VDASAILSKTWERTYSRYPWATFDLLGSLTSEANYLALLPVAEAYTSSLADMLAL
jgi:hypothetical protein